MTEDEEWANLRDVLSRRYPDIIVKKPNMTEHTRRLSKELLNPREYGRCQSCGGEGNKLWHECDHNDQPEPIAVCLCERCSERLIDPHPRLYLKVYQHQPFPGAMPTCVGCRFCEALVCKNPNLKSNGGPGLMLNFPTPTRYHWSGRGANGRRTGGWGTSYHGPVTCRGREESGATTEAEAGDSHQHAGVQEAPGPQDGGGDRAPGGEGAGARHDAGDPGAAGGGAGPTQGPDGSGGAGRSGPEPVGDGLFGTVGQGKTGFPDLRPG